jgi:hypothetical protein
MSHSLISLCVRTCVYTHHVQVYSYDQLVQEVIEQSSLMSSTLKDGGESQSEVEDLELTRCTLKRLQLPRVLSAIEEQAAHARYACNCQKCNPSYSVRCNVSCTAAIEGCAYSDNVDTAVRLLDSIFFISLT